MIFRSILVVFLFMSVSCRTKISVQSFGSLRRDMAIMPTDVYLYKDSPGNGLLAATRLNYSQGLLIPMSIELYHLNYGVLSKPMFYGSLSHPRHVAFSDINRDKTVDLLVADHGNDREPFAGARPLLLLSEGGGYALSQNKLIDFPQSFTFQTSIGDVDGDKRPDLFFANIGAGKPEAPPIFYLNNGINFTKDTKLSFPFNSSYMSSAIFDVDNDGDLDLFLGGAESFRGEPNDPFDHIYINDGQGNFTLMFNLLRKYSEWGTTSVITADLNNDGYLDLITTVYPEGSQKGDIQIRLNEQGKKFKDHYIPFNFNEISYPFFIPWVNVGDFDADGRLDFVFTIRDATGDGKPKPGSHFRYYEQRDGLLFVDETTTIKLPEAGIVAAFITDFDGDKENEIVLFDYSLGYHVVSRKNELFNGNPLIFWRD